MSRYVRFLVLALLLATVHPSSAADPSGWQEAGRTAIPWTYWQGMTHDEYGYRYFSGTHLGLWKTDRNLNEIGRNPAIIPPEVMLEENYNHIGDISYYDDKLYLPLECYYFEAGNTCENGAIAVADAQDLSWQYYVKLSTDDDVLKAMWVEVSPDGRYIWTSGGSNLQHLSAYRLSDIRPSNAAPSGRKIYPVKALPNAVPPSGVTGATFVGDRLFLAGDDGDQIWSVDTTTGARRLEIDIKFVGEAEGLDDDFDLADRHDKLPGELHWQVMHYNDEMKPPTNGLDGVIYHFQPPYNSPPSCNPKPHPRGKHRKHCH